MDPTSLPGMPAPFWFVQFFKVVGFVLHMIPMGIWFAGLPVAIGCALWNCEHSRRFAKRMFGQFPIFMALGINFGIVPLLFLQTTYYKSFYTATVLMAWHWLAVIPILIVGYYSIYLAAYSRKPARMIAFGCLASLCLIAIGILITNGLTLMVRSDLWPGIMERTNHFGATTGLANNMRDPAVWIRLATMFSLGLMTTGVWAAFDSHFLIRSKEAGVSTPAPLPAPLPIANLSAYRRWTLLLGFMTFMFGSILILAVNRFFGLTVLKGDSQILMEIGGLAVAYRAPFHFLHLIIPQAILAVLYALSLLKAGPTKLFVALLALTQLSILAGFGIMRQIGQNAGVAQYIDVSKIPTAVQWSPLIAFLVCFVLGLGVIVWMIRQTVTSDERQATNDASGNNVEIK